MYQIVAYRIVRIEMSHIEMSRIELSVSPSMYISLDKYINRSSILRSNFQIHCELMASASKKTESRS